MILCSCNLITDRDVRASVKPCGAAADRARDVFKHKGCLPNCGRCVRNIQGLCDREAAASLKERSPGPREPVLAMAAE
ncbi:MAG: bacterioferritin-associated ferredoxin [Rhodoblastus sp.]|uniref:(2Fe-2S)-binding protein n=1 Tax=Rhodoblastus sp. TaxID=1962975 RepID=UPI003FD88735